MALFKHLATTSARIRRLPPRLTRLVAISIALTVSAVAAQAATPEQQLTEMSINEVERGSLLVRGSDSSRLATAPLIDTQVEMSINGMLARVKVTQQFSYPGDDWVNGVYVFPLPEQSAVDRLRMTIGERVIEGQIKTREKARQTFKAATKAGKKATLVEQQRPNLFTTRVANIGPGETVSVELEYQQTLSYEAGWFSLRFPLTVGVRYIPGSAPVTGFDGGGWSFNTDQVTDASSITPPMTEAGRGHHNPVSIDIALNAGMPLIDIVSPYHRISTTPKAAHRYVIELEGQPVSADRDFELRFRPAPEHAPRAAFFRQQLNGEAYGLLMLVPPQADRTRQQAIPREVVFVVDTSGSMHGTSINQARAALSDGLDRLGPNDTFNIVQFNSVTQQFSAQALPATGQHIARARHYVKHLRADGGTEMAAALNLALDGKETHERLRQVIFITDGSVGNEAALFKIIDARLGASRLFTVGIGSAPNSHFMTEAAQLGRGSYVYIGAVNEVQEKISTLFDKLAFPVLADVHFESGAQALEAWPNPLPDLYVHEPIVVSLKLAQQRELRLAGRLAGKPWSTTVPVASGGQAVGLDIAWARQKIASLERSLARGAEPTKVAQQIEQLGLKHHLVTRHTSLIAVDVTASRPSSATAKDAQVPNKMPRGWSMQAPTSRLPQTATPLAAWWLLSAALGLISAGLGRVRRKS